MDSEDHPPLYKRVLIKISGEALMGPRSFGIDLPTLDAICDQIKEVKDLGTEVGLVVGGGNIFRGLSPDGREKERVTADQMGMLSTVINSLALMDTLEKKGIFTRVMSAIKIDQVAEPYIRRRAIRHMEKGRVVIFAAGTGNPYFTTDTAASLRAMEVEADIVIKATNVEGVYSADPKRVPDAIFYSKLKYMDVLTRELQVMDSTAISLLKDNNIPVRVVGLQTPGNLRRVVRGEEIGTLIS